jgi:hypothetical protein
MCNEKKAIEKGLADKAQLHGRYCASIHDPGQKHLLKMQFSCPSCVFSRFFSFYQPSGDGDKTNRKKRATEGGKRHLSALQKRQEQNQKTRKPKQTKQQS